MFENSRIIRVKFEDRHEQYFKGFTLGQDDFTGSPYDAKIYKNKKTATRAGNKIKREYNVLDFKLEGILDLL